MAEATGTRRTELAPRYDPSGLEGELYDEWVDRGLFHVAASDADDPYVIVIPPPNVTAALHMGHGLNNTIQDVLTRYRRMQGYDALYLPGTDHAGIATQNVVERTIREEGKTRFDLGREAFVERVWEWVDEYGSTIIEQLRVIGCSCDWERTRFTLDEGLSQAVREVFVRLYERGLVYRGRYIINWCPRCGTALSNEEAEHRDHTGRLYRIRYPLVGEGDAFVEVATTRPETMLGDTGLAVHPDDDRYRDLAGRTAILPLVGRELVVVADDYVDPEFGSGVVKLTPAHDPNDFEIARRHGLEALDVMTDAAEMNDAVPEPYRGLDRLEARERVVADLEAGGYLVGVEDHAHSLGRCYRCDTIVEPRLSDQWFVKMKPLAEPALEAYLKGDLRFHPERYGKIYQNWMENIRDWVISRQLWWGHRIPVWYCRENGCDEMVVAREDPDRCPACGGELEQDSDVLDTWFSSWLWPFSTLGWPEKTEDLEAFYPTDTLVTAPEILFFWVARMVMAGFEFMGELPFTDVLLNGTVRDHQGRRMSKSLGNGIDPLEVVDLYGADAMRFTLIRGAPLGTDLQLNNEDLEEAFRPGRNFANKIWNAARFALPHLSDASDPESGAERLLADRWILSRLARVTGEIDEAFDTFRLHEVAESCHSFIWGDFCDWYLELAKRRLDDPESGGHRVAALTLGEAMDGWLRLLHPIMPFVTEAIARRLPGRGPEDTLVMGPWPEPAADRIDEEAEGAIEALRELVGSIRALRAEYRLDPGKPLDVRLAGASAGLRRALSEERDAVRRMASLSTIDEVEDGPIAVEGEPGASAVLRTGGEVFIPLAGVIDLDRERERLTGETEQISGLLRATRGKLGNSGFVDNAPEEVVQRERDKLDSLAEQLERLEDKLRSLGATAS
ncbi:MAG: valine--tRNA ligase [Gemmatimonadota bacterium]|nr:valine--tRNA ligase [Gemmatimonadota bacterium]